MNIKIGFLTYKLKTMNKEMALAKNVYGYINHVDQIIYIEEGLSSQRYKEVLLHEILHGVYSQWIVESKTEEEEVVTKMANGLSTVFNDNPKLKNILI